MIRKLCDASQLPPEGSLKAFVDKDEASSLALCVGVLDGIPYAIDNVCPHARASLADGHMDGEEVVCPVHGWRWKLRGGLPSHPADPAVPAYEVRQFGDEVFVQLPDKMSK